MSKELQRLNQICCGSLGYRERIQAHIDASEARIRELEAALVEAAICLEGCRYSEMPMAKKIRAILAK